MRLWRIASETRRYPADDLSGNGAAKFPGRWNDDNESVIYCAPTIALAVLETVAHLDDAGLPQNRYLVAIDVPDDSWEHREVASRPSLPTGWDAIPAGVTSVRFGSDWLNAQRSALLTVPSVIVPEEQVVLINPKHRDGPAIRARKLRKFEYHRVLRSSRP